MSVLAKVRENVGIVILMVGVYRRVVPEIITVITNTVSSLWFQLDHA